MEIIATNGIITINETMVVVLISFLFLVYVLNRIMFRPLLDTIRRRDEYINEINTDIASHREKAETLNETLRSKEEAAKKEAFTQKKELESLGNKKAAEIVDATKQEIAEIRENAQQEVNAQFEKAKADIQKDADWLSNEIMEHILGRGVAIK
ncbi:MAG: ATP synthase F0 subunit B [Thermodesulfobacteriota bacterium]|nr:ATP synthase F0 subunit B [Thermodesulfobacteriota bacterium]